MKKLAILAVILPCLFLIAANENASTMQKRPINKAKTLQGQPLQTQGTPAITSPVSTTSLCLGMTVPITWTGLPGGGNVRIELLHTNNAFFKVVAASVPNTGTFQWNLDPKVYVFGQGTFKIRITSNNGQSIESQVVTMGKELSVYAPKSNHTWRTGSEYTIQWMKGCILPSTSVRIDLLDASMNPVSTITQSTPIDRIYKWKVPVDMKSGTYNVKITTTDNLYSATGSFKIDSPVAAPVSNPGLIIKSPLSGATLYIGDTCSINWSAPSLGDSKLKIELRHTNNEPWKVIESVAPNTGTYQFFIDPAKFSFGSGIFRLRIGKADGSVYSEIEPLTIKKK